MRPLAASRKSFVMAPAAFRIIGISKPFHSSIKNKFLISQDIFGKKMLKNDNWT
jgi:hypothetical protein